ncbi:hypothetical protein MT349_13260 [Rathayibacter caricis]|uniref:hypothetical protein n=1 Tax=Rathayibacter caricis TaxID=110936 RepID=UPI001FB31258|nr:hypothetical protein [Rathayibacter caricis]MCJ1696746.1 hypothetical protein [Rathayibacter caricis]
MRGGRWAVLIVWTATCWGLALGAAWGIETLPDNWSYSGDVPPGMILQNLLFSVGPAATTAALAMTVATVALSVARTKRPASAPADEDDPWRQDAVLLTR